MAERDSGQPESAAGLGSPGRAVGATSFLQRAVIRRRVRFLRRRRDLALHDLGGFMFESHRLAEPREELLAEKLAALGALDAELATLQRALDLREEVSVLHEPGIASCARCDTLHDSAANFCPNCGHAIDQPIPIEALVPRTLELAPPPPPLAAVEDDGPAGPSPPGGEHPSPDASAATGPLSSEPGEDPAADTTAVMATPFWERQRSPAPDATAVMAPVTRQPGEDPASDTTAVMATAGPEALQDPLPDPSPASAEEQRHEDAAADTGASMPKPASGADRDAATDATVPAPAWGADRDAATDTSAPAPTPARQSDGDAPTPASTRTPPADWHSRDEPMGDIASAVAAIGDGSQEVDASGATVEMDPVEDHPQGSPGGEATAPLPGAHGQRREGAAAADAPS